MPDAPADNAHTAALDPDADIQATVDQLIALPIPYTIAQEKQRKRKVRKEEPHG